MLTTHTPRTYSDAKLGITAHEVVACELYDIGGRHIHVDCRGKDTFVLCLEEQGSTTALHYATVQVGFIPEYDNARYAYDGPNGCEVPDIDHIGILPIRAGASTARRRTTYRVNLRDKGMAGAYIDVALYTDTYIRVLIEFI